jgi:hypothetical protein
MERVNETAVVFLPWNTIEAEAQQQILNALNPGTRLGSYEVTSRIDVGAPGGRGSNQTGIWSWPTKRLLPTRLTQSGEPKTFHFRRLTRRHRRCVHI